MSSLPTPYTRQASFTGFHVPERPTLGQDLEAEFNAVKQSQDQTQARLSEIQRDDGKLSNLSVHPDALSQAVRSLLATQSGEIKGLWASGLVYDKGDVIEAPDGVTYIAVVDHVANASFSVDLAAGRWISIDSGKAFDTQLRADLNDVALGSAMVRYDADETVKQRLDAVGPIRTDLAGNGGAALVGYQRQDGVSSTVQANLREKLTADRTYYVRTNGSDANNGLADTAGGAFLTLQRAVDVVYNTLDFNGRNVVIQVASGTYTVGCTMIGPHVGKGDLYFIGDQTTPANVLVSTTAVGGHGFALYEGAAAIIRGFKVATAGAGACCILAYTGSSVNVGAIEYGACANMHNEIGSESVATFFAPYIISGGAVGHWHTGSPAQINVGLMAATITGTPHFSSYFAGTAGGFIVCKEFNWTGSATGVRYLAHKGGVIDGNAGLNPFLPGDAVGRVATGGIAKAGNTFPVDISADVNVSDSVRIGATHTGTGAFTPMLTVISANPPVGYFELNGTSYNKSDTTLGAESVVDCAVGTNDGTSLRNTAAGILFQGSTNLAHYGQVRRRGNDGAIWLWYRDTTNVGNISITTTATAYNTSSDERLKQAIEPAPYDPDWILQVADQVKEFSFKVSPLKRVVGFIAQWLNPIAPEAVSPGDDNPGLRPDEEGFEQWGVDNAKLLPKLILEVAALRRRLDQQG